MYPDFFNFLVSVGLGTVHVGCVHVQELLWSGRRVSGGSSEVRQQSTLNLVLFTLKKSSLFHISSPIVHDMNLKSMYITAWNVFIYYFIFLHLFTPKCYVTS